MVKYLKIFQKEKNKSLENKTPVDFTTLQDYENTVFILDHHLISRNKISYYNCNQNIDDIQVLYFTCINNKPLLFVAGKHNSHIPTSSLNFLPTFLHLAKIKGFNPVQLSLFEDTFSCQRNMFIWARKNPRNFKLLSKKEVDDTILKGYELQNNEKTFITWNTSYADIITLSEISTCQSDNEDDLLKYSFTVPIRVGNIILEDFSFYDCERKNIPVQNYFSYCDCDQISKPYIHLKNALLENQSLVDTCLTTEIDSSTIYSTKLRTDDLEFYFSNAYPTDLDAANNRVFFLITNLRDYLEAVVYPASIEKLSIANCTTLSGDIMLNMVRYKETPYIYRLPTFIQELSQNRPFIWIDDNNGEVGFSDNQYAHILLLADILYMTIHTIEKKDGTIESALWVKTIQHDFMIPMFTSISIDLHLFEQQIKRDIPIPLNNSFDDYVYS